jgi:tetratricopeptide (TPR) repeat protein
MRCDCLAGWLGAVAATAYAAVLFRRRINDWRFVAGGTLLFATTSAILVPIDMLGFNDAWVWLGLLAVAFGDSAWAVPVACLLCPWIDERFVIGFPLAWLIGRYQRGKSWDWPAMREALWLVPYAAIRLWIGRHDSAASAATTRYLSTYVPDSIMLLPIVPIGWWMGLRAAWLGVAYAGWTASPGRRMMGAATLLVTGIVSVMLALDLSRSIAIVMPAVFLGCFEYARRAPLNAPRALLAAGIANLFIPAASVWAQNVEPICPLPTEIMKWHTNVVYGGGPVDNAISQTIISPSPENFLILADRYFQRRQFEDSLGAAQEALRLRPGYAEGYAFVASTSLSLGRGDDAVAAARESLRLKPDFQPARNILNVAESRLQKATWDAAKGYLGKMLGAAANAGFGTETNSGDDSGDSQNWTKDTVLEPDGTYRVTMWADTRDSSGARVRTHYVMALRYRGALHWEMIEKPTVTGK